MKYLYICASFLLWVSTLICYYFWYMASQQLGRVAKYDGINDPASIGWTLSSKDYLIADNALTFGFFLSIVVTFLIIFLRLKKVLEKKTIMIGGIGVILFLVICLGGFLSWMNY